MIAIEASATAVPTPLKVAVCGLLLALSLNRSVPVLDPIALGENETDATQLAPTRPEAVPVQIQIPLKDLTRGEYVCQINVVDEVGRKFAFPRAPIIVQ